MSFSTSVLAAATVLLSARVHGQAPNLAPPAPPPTFAWDRGSKDADTDGPGGVALSMLIPILVLGLGLFGGIYCIYCMKPPGKWRDHRLL